MACGPEELDVVRVVQLLAPYRELDGDERVRRQPRVGDVGTIVDLPSMCVEMVDGEGRTVWVAHFERAELEPVSRCR